METNAKKQQKTMIKYNGGTHLVWAHKRIYTG